MYVFIHIYMHTHSHFFTGRPLSVLAPARSGAPWRRDPPALWAAGPGPGLGTATARVTRGARHKDMGKTRCHPFLPKPVYKAVPREALVPCHTVQRCPPSFIHTGAQNTYHQTPLRENAHKLYLLYSSDTDLCACAQTVTQVPVSVDLKHYKQCKILMTYPSTQINSPKES